MLQTADPLEEARHPRALLSARTVLTTPGVHTPAPTRLKETVRHNVAGGEALVHPFPQGGLVKNISPARSHRKRFWVPCLFVSIGTLLSFAALLLFLLGWSLGNFLMSPQRVALTHLPTVPYQAVQLETGDRVSIRSWFLPAPSGAGKAPALLLLHGVSDNRTVFTRICPVVEAKDGCPLTRPSSIKSTYPTLVDALHQSGDNPPAGNSAASGASLLEHLAGSRPLSPAHRR